MIQFDWWQIYLIIRFNYYFIKDIDQCLKINLFPPIFFIFENNEEIYIYI